jgi:hypothetical protein
MRQITYAEANQRFFHQGRSDIELIELYYITWKKNAKFFDKILGEVFEAIPKNLCKQNYCHPKRAIEQRKKTNIKLYGNICSLHGKEMASELLTGRACGFSVRSIKFYI